MTEKDFYRTMIKIASAGFLLASACTAEAQVATAIELPIGRLLETGAQTAD